MTDEDAIARVIQILKENNKIVVIVKKLERVQKAVRKENFEKVFWQRKCKFYAPNYMEQHYAELDQELKKAGLYIERNDKL
jgi:hypothetical protein